MYELLFAEIVGKQVKELPVSIKKKVEEIVSQLKSNPRPFKCKKLKGGENAYRIRTGDWRVLYEINDRQQRVIIYGVLHRKEAYR